MTKCDKDSDVTPLTNQELGHRIRSLEARASTAEQNVTELMVSYASLNEHLKHISERADRTSADIRKAVWLVLAAVIAAILALVLHVDGRTGGTGAASSSSAPLPSSSTTSSGR